ncbi:MAG: hypothetical protein ACJAT2_002162 [Bacteriovoracaceae bacterium]|jgi:hypothetical protein
MKIIFIYFLLIGGLSAKEYVLKEWKSCQSDKDCQVVKDMGCKSPCQSEAINLRFSKDLSQKINKDCADLLVPQVDCAYDSRVKIPRCIQKKCKLMAKHICCTLKDPKLRKSHQCHIENMDCNEVPF